MEKGHLFTADPREPATLCRESGDQAMPRNAIAFFSTLAFLTTALAQQPCCGPTGTPGCSDAACSAAVCEVDPACCSTAWDQRCADEASVLCVACRTTQPCQLPIAHRQELEPCGAAIDDACPDPLHPADPLASGEIVAGQVWADDTSRDVDWFEVVLTAPGSLAVECWSGGPVGAAIVEATCPPTVFAESSDGCPGRCSACLPAGTYRIAVRSLLFEAIPCGDPRGNYAIRAQVSPCTPDQPLEDRCEFAQAIGEGVVAFDSRDASTDPAWLPASCNEGAGLAFTHDVWFSFTADATGVFRIGTCETGDFDARIAIYESCGGLPLACSDDTCQGGAAEVDVGLSCGTQVLVRLGGWGHGAAGMLQIEALDAVPCACEADLDGSGIVDGGDIALILLCFGDAGGAADLDRDLEVGPGDIAIALLSTGPCS
jgi:hypothetical protein